MSIENLRTFLAVWYSGSFTAAAEELAVAPSSVSRAIAALEGELGARLFQRTTRAMRPTEAGERLFPRASGLVEEWDAARQALAGEQAQLAGRLRISSSIAFSQIVIAPMLKRFKADHPDLTIDLHLSDDRVNLVEEQIDIAIRHGRMEDSSLIARKLGAVRYHLVASPRLSEQIGKIEDPEELRQVSLVTFSFGEFRRQWEFRRGQDTRRVQISPTITATNALVIREAVLNDCGAALLADWMIEDELERGELVPILPDWNVSGALAQSDLWLVYPSRSFIPAKTRIFAEFLEAEFRSQVR
ncbi:transcriptional regulator (LysR family protein) [Erythrobacter sp. NAP1]|uniref:LysR family transcriptional regulator n=1 Tax=Erythrobacter sp. NAP1 TaxID=237727 RepID=UPI000068794C|nr:LysR family transcriptional regulator [Erythrobacter sp. NAP1]EAQ28976.1 transcriptional regulator (LysR family protein) [Erythrobacter sp. NAP1]